MPQSRGRNYDPSEGLELVRAWIRVSTDAATGVNQTAEVFWTRVKKTMEESDTIAAAIESGMYEYRTWTSLKSHFSDISKKVSKFVRCAKKIESLRESGTTERDALVQAHELYLAETKTVFQYQACYAELWVCPKFQKHLVGSKKRKSLDTDPTMASSTVEASGASGTSVSDVHGSQEKVNGVKAAKTRRGQEQLQARAVKAQESMATTMESKNEIAKTRLRIQEEQALQLMLNEMYAIQPQNAEHAQFLEDRRYSLLTRLKLFEAADLPIPPSTSIHISELCAPLPENANSSNI